MRLGARCAALAAGWMFLIQSPLAAQSLTLDPGPEAVEIRFVDTELKAVVQSLGRYLDKPILAPGLPQVRVTLETPEPVARASIRALLRGLAESHNLTVEEDSTYIHIRPRQAEPSALAFVTNRSDVPFPSASKKSGGPSSTLPAGMPVGASCVKAFRDQRKMRPGEPVVAAR